MGFVAVSSWVAWCMGLSAGGKSLVLRVLTEDSRSRRGRDRGFGSLRAERFISACVFGLGSDEDGTVGVWVGVFRTAWHIGQPILLAFGLRRPSTHFSGSALIRVSKTGVESASSEGCDLVGSIQPSRQIAASPVESMNDAYCLFKRDENGAPIGIDTVLAFKQVKKRLIKLSSIRPGSYLVYDPTKAKFVELFRKSA